jgi:hypothetical protein
MENPMVSLGNRPAAMTWGRAQAMAPVAGVTTDVSSAHMAEIEIPILGLNVQALAPPEAWATIWRGDGSWVKTGDFWWKLGKK